MAHTTISPPTLFPIATSIRTNCTVTPGVPPSISIIEDWFDHDYYCCGDITNNQEVTSCNQTEASPYAETCGSISFEHPYTGILHGSGLLSQNKDNKDYNTLIDVLQKNKFMAMYGEIIKGKNPGENLSKLSEVMDANRDLSDKYPDFDSYKMLVDLKLHKAGRLNSYSTALTGQPNIQRMFARESASSTSTINSLLNYSGSRIDFKCENTNGIDDNSEDNIMLQSFVVNIEPNPVSDATNISFDLPTKSRIKVYLTNALGEVIDNISNTIYAEGRNSINYHNSTLSNGVYYCIFEWKGGMKSEKIILIR
ncbi:MAG: T9SS type A sorting domain-containing protein [Ignavibacteria bacterium]|nr:T9SS type A sorting domain-containing protein [Ignavibacteria bacterium]